MDLITEKSKDYELIDSGEGEKWSKRKPEEWQKANAEFSRGTGAAGKWKIHSEILENWGIELEDLKFSLKLLPSKHVGVFPEQSSHWRWLQEKISLSPPLGLDKFISPRGGLGENTKGNPVCVLNLFGYTGGASLACVKAGAQVVHVDASEWAVTSAKENAKLSGLGDRPIRFMVDDARKFVEREIKRGNKYDVIVLDPPVYGKGAKKEVWNIETDLMPLLARLKMLLSKEPLAILLNGYASDYSHITYKQMLSEVVKDMEGNITSGELALQESGTGRLLSSGIFARWEK